MAKIILTYIDNDGNSHDLPPLTKKINNLMKDVDTAISKSNEDVAFTKMLELVKLCLGDEVVKELFGSLKYDDNLWLTDLNVACVEIAKAYRKPVNDAQFENDAIDKALQLATAYKTMANVK